MENHWITTVCVFNGGPFFFSPLRFHFFTILLVNTEPHTKHEAKYRIITDTNTRYKIYNRGLLMFDEKNLWRNLVLFCYFVINTFIIIIFFFLFLLFFSFSFFFFLPRALKMFVLVLAPCILYVPFDWIFRFVCKTQPILSWILSRFSILICQIALIYLVAGLSTAVVRWLHRGVDHHYTSKSKCADVCALGRCTDTVTVTCVCIGYDCFAQRYTMLSPHMVALVALVPCTGNAISLTMLWSMLCHIAYAYRVCQRIYAIHAAVCVLTVSHLYLCSNVFFIQFIGSEFWSMCRLCYVELV